MRTFFALIVAGCLCLVAGGASAAAVPTYFQFLDDNADNSSAFELVFSSGDAASVQLFDTGANLALQIDPTSVGGTANLIQGNIEYNFSTKDLNFLALAGGTQNNTVGATGKLLVNDVFSVGVAGGSITLITALDTAETIFQFDYALTGGGTGSFTLDDITVSVVPIPAAGVMLLSALAGLLVVGRRSKSKERARQTGTLAAA